MFIYNSRSTATLNKIAMKVIKGKMSLRGQTKKRKCSCPDEVLAKTEEASPKAEDKPSARKFSAGRRIDTSDRAKQTTCGRRSTEKVSNHADFLDRRRHPEVSTSSILLSGDFTAFGGHGE